MRACAALPKAVPRDPSCANPLSSIDFEKGCAAASPCCAAWPPLLLPARPLEEASPLAKPRCCQPLRQGARLLLGVLLRAPALAPALPALLLALLLLTVLLHAGGACLGARPAVRWQTGWRAPWLARRSRASRREPSCRAISDRSAWRAMGRATVGDQVTADRTGAHLLLHDDLGTAATAVHCRQRLQRSCGPGTRAHRAPAANDARGRASRQCWQRNECTSRACEGLDLRRCVFDLRVARWRWWTVPCLIQHWNWTPD
jgi:hypothetical protein